MQISISRLAVSDLPRDRQVVWVGEDFIGLFVVTAPKEQVITEDETEIPDAIFYRIDPRQTLVSFGDQTLCRCRWFDDNSGVIEFEDGETYNVPALGGSNGQVRTFAFEVEEI